MKTCWLVYCEADASGNDWYINHYIECLKKYNIECRLIIKESLSLVDGFNFMYKEEMLEKPDAVINRTRSTSLAEYFENIGVKVFNNSKVTLYGNDKYLAYEFVKKLGIPVMDTILIRKNEEYEYNFSDIKVVKSLDGHGGTEVFTVKSREEFDAIRSQMNCDIILQSYASDIGKDLRVYTVGNEVIKGMLRVSTKDFRSNFCLGGNAYEHELSKKELDYANRIMEALDIGHAAIDFIYDNGEPVFNEIEDMCGSRMLYQNTDIDIVDMYTSFISKVI